MTRGACRRRKAAAGTWALAAAALVSALALMGFQVLRRAPLLTLEWYGVVDAREDAAHYNNLVRSFHIVPAPVGAPFIGIHTQSRALRDGAMVRGVMRRMLFLRRSDGVEPPMPSSPDWGFGSRLVRFTLSNGLILPMGKWRMPRHYPRNYGLQGYPVGNMAVTSGEAESALEPAVAP